MSNATGKTLSRAELNEAAKEVGINNIPVGATDEQLQQLIQDAVKAGRTGNVQLQDDRPAMRTKGVAEKKKSVPRIPNEVLTSTEATILCLRSEGYPVKVGNNWEGELKLNTQLVVPLYVAMHLAETGAAIIIRIEQDISEMITKK